MSGSKKPGSELCLITNRRLSIEPLEERAGKALAAGASYLMMREKDLEPSLSMDLSKRLSQIAGKTQARFIVNGSLEAALASQAWGWHLPFSLMPERQRDKLPSSLTVGVSVHSLEEALAAQDWGAGYVLAGHIFDTPCKDGSEGRGLDFLSLLRERLAIPLWAVGGIKPQNAKAVVRAGAAVICLMSGLLCAEDPENMTRAILKEIN
jgi:thiamine-phosphate pyrophosphorylase